MAQQISIIEIYALIYEGHLIATIQSHYVSLYAPNRSLKVELNQASRNLSRTIHNTNFEQHQEAQMNPQVLPAKKRGSHHILSRSLSH